MSELFDNTGPYNIIMPYKCRYELCKASRIIHYEALWMHNNPFMNVFIGSDLLSNGFLMKVLPTIWKLQAAQHRIRTTGQAVSHKRR